MADWFATLTVENIEDVANMIHETLEGKRYTWVAVNMRYNDTNPGRLIGRPEVRTSQSLEGKNPGIWHGEDGRTGFHFSDTYGVWGCWTRNHDPNYDDEFNSPYVVITKHRKVEITQRAPLGHILYWTLAVEEEI